MIFSSTSNPPDSPGALHIFNWASSSIDHYRRMKALEKYPREGSFSANAAGEAFNLAREVYHAMRGDRQGEHYSAEEILGAAVLFLQWESE